MKLFKKIILLTLCLCLLLTGVACSNSNGGDNPDNPDNPENPATAQVAKISASLLDGKIANLMEAQGFGILDKTGKEEPSTKAKSYSLVSYADGEEKQEKQKKTELVKKTKDGVSDIHFHKVEDSARKSYRKLNKKYDKHHHDTVECQITDCEKISDEILQEENSGEVDTVLSLDARVNKLYTVGDFTFVSISSAIEGNVSVWTRKEMVAQAFYNSPEFPTRINVEDSFNEGYSFSWISVLGENGEKLGMIPIKALDDEKNYHKINYWSDDYNQSYIIDNKTGLTYSLSQFKYIYSVIGGVIKVFTDSGFVYYRPVVANGEIQFNKIELPLNDQEFANKVDGCSFYTDIYGNMLFSATWSTSTASDMDRFGERKLGDKLIFAQKNLSSMYSVQGSDPSVSQLIQRNYLSASRYHNGSDGRLYRVNFFGDFNNVSVNVLDENCTWQSVENDITVEFTDAYICWQISFSVANWDGYQITRIIDGNAYFSTASFTDGGRLFNQPFFHNRFDAFVGVVKIPTDGFTSQDNEVSRFIQDFKMKDLPVRDNYSVFLVGKTQMLYFGHNNEVFLRDIKTGQEVSFTAEFTNYGPEKGGNLYIQGVGYLNLENELDMATFGVSSFSAEPVIIKSEFEEYYKLLMDLS